MMKKISGAQIALLAGVVLCCCLAVVAWFGDVAMVESTTALVEKHKSGVGMLTEVPVSQTFMAEQQGMRTLEVMFSNFQKKPKEGTLTLWLTNGNGDEIARQEYAVNDCKNNAFLTLALPKAEENSEGIPYTLWAASDCTDQKGVTLRQGPAAQPNSATVLTLADGTVDVDNALNLRIGYAVPSYGWMPACACVLVGLCLLTGVPFAGRKEKHHG